jgi:hypothetical protein
MVFLPFLFEIVPEPVDVKQVPDERRRVIEVSTLSASVKLPFLKPLLPARDSAPVKHEQRLGLEHGIAGVVQSPVASAPVPTPCKVSATKFAVGAAANDLDAENIPASAITIVPSLSHVVLEDIASSY